MVNNNDIPVVYSNGVLRPDVPLGLPENSRVRIAIRRVEVTSEQESHGKAVFNEIRRKGLIRLDGWRPSRDELHERG